MLFCTSIINSEITIYIIVVFIGIYEVFIMSFY